MKVLIIAPHADDEALGMGGTIARMSHERHDVVVGILTGHGNESNPVGPQEQWDTVRSEALLAHKALGVKQTIFRELPAVLLPDKPVYQINKEVEDLIFQAAPDILFIPFIYDLHKDHRELVYACNIAWRPVTKSGRKIKEIYMYETLSETHWNIQPYELGFAPNVFYDITGRYLEIKITALKFYESQMRAFPDIRSIECIEALAKYRGASVGVHAAEAFVLVRRIT